MIWMQRYAYILFFFVFFCTNKYFLTQFCSCGLFQRKDIPCRHGVALIHANRQTRLSPYVPPILSIKRYERTYPQDSNLEPIQLPSLIDLQEGRVPLIERPPGFMEGMEMIPPAGALDGALGRHRMNRLEAGRGRPQRQDAEENRERQQRCSQCHRRGHKVTTCREENPLAGELQ